MRNNKNMSEYTTIKRTYDDKDEISFIEQHSDMDYVFIKDKSMVTQTTPNTASYKSSSEDVYPDSYSDDKCNSSIEKSYALKPNICKNCYKN